MEQEQILSALSNVQEPDLGKDLVTLNNALTELGDKPVRRTFDNFIIYPVN